MKRALVVSTGGSKGAYAGGIIDYYTSQGITYDILIGSSTGALIVPLVASENIEALKKGYTSIKHSDIFNVNPFKVKKKKDGTFSYRLNNLNIFYNCVIKKRVGLGDTQVLRDKTIPNFFTLDDYNTILDNKKLLEVVVSNITLGVEEYKKLEDNTYEQFCDWIWASTCAPPYMSVPRIGKYQYSDGVLSSVVPVKQAIIRGADIIDVIVLNKELPDVNHNDFVKSPIHLLVKSEYMKINTIRKQNLNMGMLTDVAKKKVRINFHYTERTLIENSLIFDKEMMNIWWDEGHSYAERDMCKSYIIDGVSKKYYLVDKDV